MSPGCGSIWIPCTDARGQARVAVADLSQGLQVRYRNLKADGKALFRSQGAPGMAHPWLHRPPRARSEHAWDPSPSSIGAQQSKGSRGLGKFVEKENVCPQPQGLRGTFLSREAASSPAGPSSIAGGLWLATLPTCVSLPAFCHGWSWKVCRVSLHSEAVTWARLPGAKGL